jgi:hypothetical protein
MKIRVQKGACSRKSDGRHRFEGTWSKQAWPMDASITKMV